MKNRYYLICFLLLLLGCSEIEARRPISVRTHTTLASTSNDFKKLNKIADNEVLNYIKLDSTQTYINSKNGFWYTTLSKSESKIFPKYGDQVTYSLEILDLNNQVIYSQNELGVQNYLVDKQELITGLQKGIKLMNEGDRAKFLIPAYSAYGVVGDQNRVGSNQSIIAIITLQKIK